MAGYNPPGTLPLIRRTVRRGWCPRRHSSPLAESSRTSLYTSTSSGAVTRSSAHTSPASLPFSQNSLQRWKRSRLSPITLGDYIHDFTTAHITRTLRELKLEEIDMSNIVGKIAAVAVLAVLVAGCGTISEMEREVEIRCECRNPDGQMGDARKSDDGTIHVCMPVTGMPTSSGEWRWSCAWHSPNG